MNKYKLFLLNNGYDRIWKFFAIISISIDIIITLICVCVGVVKYMSHGVVEKVTGQLRSQFCLSTTKEPGDWAQVLRSGQLPLPAGPSSQPSHYFDVVSTSFRFMLLSLDENEERETNLPLFV